MTGRPRRDAAPSPAAAELERSVLYSEELGLDLSCGRERDLFLWLVAAMLFGARISESIARHTYRVLVGHRLTSPRRVLDAGHDFLVNPVMRDGGYVRYDGRKSDQLLRVSRALLDEYGGKVSNVHEAARDAADLESRLAAFHGIGPVTVNIFLRELRPHWRLADPDVLPAVRDAARALGIDLARYDRKSTAFTRLEAGLVRLRHRRRGHS